MECSLRILTLVALAFGLLATGALTLAVCTDFWLFTTEPLPRDAIVLPVPTVEGEMEMEMEMEYDTEVPMEVVIQVHSGLWRMCMIHEDEMEPQTPSCAVINYFQQDWDRIQGADTTWSILRGIRKSSPVIVFGLLLSIIAFTLSTLGNSKHDKRTISGAVFYIFSALFLAVGVILYISAVNDEVSHRKKPANPDGALFSYRYGWAFFFAGGSFICAMCAAVTNITIYLKRYPSLEDMVDIIPGLEKKGSSFYKISSDDEGPEVSGGSLNPTLFFK